MDLEETAVKPKGKKRGRPKKVETFESDLEDLDEKFGVKALAKELAGMGAE
jgi:hypothetical protein